MATTRASAPKGLQNASRACVVLVAATLLVLADRDLRAESLAGPIPASSVGLPVAVTELVLPGSELEAIPITDETPIVIRIDAVRPHGTDHRYDFSVSALEPGTFDLRDFLRRRDGGPVDDLPELTFEVASLLPPGQVEPHRPAAARLPWYWDYRIVVSVLVGLWVAGLLALLRVGRRRRRVDDGAAATRPISLADRLRPLVADAIAGRLDSARLAELERALIAFWRRRAGLRDVPNTEVLARLHAHPEAGPLLVRLEEWLHHPPGDTDDNPARRTAEVAELLAPYADLPPDALDGDSALDGHARPRPSSPRVEAVS